MHVARGHHGGGPVSPWQERPTLRRRLVDEADQRVAALAHLTIAFGVLIGVGFVVGLAIDLVIWLRGRRSPFVAFHAEQAGTYQLTVFVLNIVFAVVWIAGLIALLDGSPAGAGVLSTGHVLLGLGGWLVALGLFVVWYVGTILLGVYAGLRIAAGGDFTYPLIGTRIRRRMAAQSRRTD